MAGIVFGQERGDVHIEREDVADGVLILDARKTPEGLGAARVWTRRCGAIELTLEMRSERVVGHVVGPRHSRRRHHAATNLADDFFPRLGIGANARHIERIECEATGLRSAVVARDAVAIEYGAISRGSGSRR